MRRAFYILVVVLVLTGCGGKQDKGVPKAVEETAPADEKTVVKALFDAVNSGDLDKVKEFIKKGADVNTKGKRGKTLLHLAVNRANTETVRFLIAQGADVNARDENGFTPLHREGAISGSPEQVVKTAELLLASGADINVRGNSGLTPLYTAVIGAEDEKLAALYIAEGADINARTDDGHTPLDCAIDCRNEKAVEILRQHGATMQEPTRVETTKAVESGELEKIKMLVTNGANIIGVNDIFGSTLLHKAVEAGHKEMVEFLVGNGAAVNAIDDWGNTPLHHCGKRDVAEILIANGADMNIREEMSGNTALHVAIEKVRWEVVKALIAANADLNVKNERGWTALHLAAERQYDNWAIEYLINSGAGVNAIDNYGKTPLDYAHRDSLKELLRKHGGKPGK